MPIVDMLNVIVLNVDMLNAIFPVIHCESDIMPIVDMLTVIVLNVDMLNAIFPVIHCDVSQNAEFQYNDC
jgi:hypothetical protein